MNLAHHDTRLIIKACTGGKKSAKQADLGNAAASSTIKIPIVSWSSSQPTPAPTTPESACEILCNKAKGGCTYSTASNYDSTATLDDGSCSFTTLKGCPDHLHGISTASDCPANAGSLPQCDAGGLRAGEYCLEDGTCSDGKGTVCAVVTTVRRHAILRADHGHLRSIVDADGYGRAELYAVGHKRADQVRRIRSPLHLFV